MLGEVAVELPRLVVAVGSEAREHALELGRGRWEEGAVTCRARPRILDVRGFLERSDVDHVARQVDDRRADGAVVGHPRRRVVPPLGHEEGPRAAVRGERQPFAGRRNRPAGRRGLRDSPVAGMRVADAPRLPRRFAPVCAGAERLHGRGRRSDSDLVERVSRDHQRHEGAHDRPRGEARDPGIGLDAPLDRRQPEQPEDERNPDAAPVRPRERHLLDRHAVAADPEPVQQEREVRVRRRRGHAAVAEIRDPRGDQHIGTPLTRRHRVRQGHAGRRRDRADVRVAER